MEELPHSHQKVLTTPSRLLNTLDLMFNPERQTVLKRKVLLRLSLVGQNWERDPKTVLERGSLKV